MELYKNKYLRSFAWFIKDYNKALSVLGLLFFILALVFGFIWLSDTSNDKLEPLTFVLGVFSTIFFGLPQLAEFILPSRKSIHHMTYDELIDFILHSDPVNDWQYIERDIMEESFLKEDPRLRIYAKLLDEGIHNENFQEVWANQHPDPSAISFYYNILYDGNFIKRIILVSVDGNRADLPLPKAGTLEVSEFDYRIAQIVDSGNRLDEYMNRSGLQVAKK